MKTTRDGFGDELYELVKNDKNIVVATADVGESVKIGKIRADFPEQFVEVGVAEQNLIGVCAGIAMTGKTVVAAGFAAFNPGRNWEQIRVSVCEQKLDVKIVGSHAGLATGEDGKTHQALEDIALMSVLPGMRVLSPCDYKEARDATKAMIKNAGPMYLRLTREGEEKVSQGKTKFVFGKGRLPREGDDAAIIATGLTVPLALEVADNLAKDADLQIAVVNLPTLKPLDEELITTIARQTGVIVTIEDHQLIGGMGSMVASVLARTEPTIMEMIGIPDQFGQSGTRGQLYEAYGLSVENLRETVLRAIERKCAWIEKFKN